MKIPKKVENLMQHFSYVDIWQNFPLLYLKKDVLTTTAEKVQFIKKWQAKEIRIRTYEYNKMLAVKKQMHR